MLLYAKKASLSFLIFILLIGQTFSYVSANELQDQAEVRSRVLQLQQSDPTLPGGASEQKGVVGTLLSRLFNSDGKIKQIFLQDVFSGLSGGKIAYYSDGNDAFLDSVISASPTAIGIGAGLLSGYIANFTGDVNIIGDLDVSGRITASDPTQANEVATKNYVDGLSGVWDNSRGDGKIFYNPGGATPFVGIGTSNPYTDLHVVGNIRVTGSPSDPADVGNRSYNDARYINIGSSGDQIQDGTIDETEIADGSIRSQEIATNAVGTSEIINNSITASDIGVNAVGNSELGVNAVLTGNIQDSTITSADLAPGSVGSSEVIDNSLTASDLAANSVGSSELANNAVTGAKITDGTILAADIGANAVGNSELIDNPTVTSLTITGTPTSSSDAATKSYVDNLVQGLVWKEPNSNSQTCNSSREGWATYNTTTNIVYVCNGTSWVDIGSTAVVPNATTTSAGKVQLSGDIGGTWNNVQLNANTVGSSEITDNSITASDIATSAVRSDEILNNTITETDISDSFVARAASKVNASSYGWIGDLNASPRSMYDEGISVGLVNAASHSAPISYGSLVNFPSYTAGQDGGAGQLLFPYDLSYTGNGNPMFRTGDYNNAGWSSWKTMMDKDWADSLYIGVGDTIPGDQIQDGTIDSSEIQDNTLTANDLAANSVGNSELIDVPTVTQLNLAAGNNNGVRFWSSDLYEISMGNAATHQYGPVNNYSIKTNMSNTNGRGFTWGVSGLSPTVAFEAQSGDAQFAGEVEVGELKSNGSTWIQNNTYNALLVEGNTANNASSLGSVVEINSNSDYRGHGNLLTVRDANTEWFAGVPYTGGGYSIGYDASGGQSEYKANSKLFIGSDGDAEFAGDVNMENAQIRKTTGRSLLSLGNPSVIGDNNSNADFYLYGENNGVVDQATISKYSSNMGIDAGAGSLQLYSPTQVLEGQTFQIHNSNNTDYVRFQHDGTDLNITDANTADININGMNVNVNGQQVVTNPNRTLTQKADIGGGVNLNTMATTGLYHQNSNASATSGSNYPVDLAGMLEVVEDGNMVYQKYHVYGSTNDLYTRTRYNGTWYPWNNVSDGLSDGYWEIDGTANGGGSAGDDLKFEGNNADVRFYSWSDCSNCKADLEFFKSTGNSDSNKQIVGGSDMMGGVRFYGYDGDEYIGTAGIFAQVDGTPGNNSIPTKIFFTVAGENEDVLYTNGNDSYVKMVLDNDGYLGVGVLNPSYRLELPNSSSAAGRGRANAWHTYSSRRWKENIQPITGALENIEKLQGITYDWKDEQGGRPDIGFVAEEVGAIFPEMVEWEENGVDAKGLAYDRITAVLVEGVKELLEMFTADAEETDAEIQELQSEVEELKEIVKDLKKQIEK